MHRYCRKTARPRLAQEQTLETRPEGTDAGDRQDQRDRRPEQETADENRRRRLPEQSPGFGGQSRPCPAELQPGQCGGSGPAGATGLLPSDADQTHRPGGAALDQGGKDPPLGEGVFDFSDLDRAHQKGLIFVRVSENATPASSLANPWPSPAISTT